MDEPTVRFDLDPLVAPRERHLRGYRQRVPTEPAYEVVSEFAHIVAGYAAIEGAVVMTHHCELLGFGGEISGDLEPVLSVDRALDPEGELTVREGVETVGTRHRSAYRLARAMPDAVSVVVSQDGNDRFVTDRANAVTCWDQS